jgi:riboflavin synthase
MFSGIIRAKTKIVDHAYDCDSLFLTFQIPEDWQVSPGDSIATNGTCLTVKTIDQKAQQYTAELMPETLKKTTFGLEEFPLYVNLERSLAANNMLDGHIVTGHVDALGVVSNVSEQGNTHILTISFPQEFAHLIAEKGSITVDGVSLTVVDVGDDFFTVSLVDYTWQHTTLSNLEKGSQVNLEFDILAKYVARQRSE